MMGCNKCSSMCGWTVLILGILFLLQDLGRWSFWNIKWWTIMFIVTGISYVAMSNCNSCQIGAVKKGRR